MKHWKWVIVAMALATMAGPGFSQGALGKKERGNGNSNGSGNGGSQGEKSRPPVRESPPQRENPPSRPPVERERPPVRENPPSRPPIERERPPANPPSDPPSQRERPPIRENPPTDPGRNTDPGQGALGKGRGNTNQGGGSNSGGSSGRSDPPVRNSGGSSGGGQGKPPIGRIENPPRGGNDRIGGGNSQIGGVRRENQGALGKGRADGGYGTNNNQRESSKGGAPVSIGKAPRSVMGGSLEHQVLREDRAREIRRSGWRVGYWGYDPYWRDDNFRFGWYVFSPYASYRCYSSPWYYYPHLPGYINYSCVRVLTLNFGPFHWADYRWSRPYDNGYYGSYGYERQYSALDYALDDIVKAFERQDSRALGRVAPRRGDVNIWQDGRYEYSMDADAFYDLMEDNVFSTRTVDYQILSSRTYRDYAEVSARHEYVDPWNRRVSVYHWYRLERERDGYVIRNFGTSDSRW